MAPSKKLFLAAAFIFFTLCTMEADAAQYKRIVSLYPGHTDNIIALGGSERLIAISENEEESTLPALPRLPLKTGAEAVLALHPDLVLIRALVQKQNPQLARVLERAGVKVVMMDTPSWNEFDAYLQKLAPLIGKSPQEASAKLSKLKNELATDAARYHRKKKPLVLVEATAKELHTCSPDSWASRLIALAGGVNAASGAKASRNGSAIAPWGLERTLKLAGSGLNIYLVQNGPMNMSTKAEVEKRPWYQVLKKSVKVAYIPEYYLSRSSLTSLEKGGRELIKIFYGE